MPNAQELFDMSQVDITDIDKTKLRDISTVEIDQKLSHEGKILSYIEQMENPYCFLSGDVSVGMRFVGEDRSLSQSLVSFFLKLKQR